MSYFEIDKIASNDAKQLFIEWMEKNDRILSEDDLEKQYREMLDEFPVKIGSLEWDGSYVLEELDPTAYRCGFADFTGSGDYWEADDYVSNSYLTDDPSDLWDEFLEEETVRYCSFHRLYEPVDQFNTPMFENVDDDEPMDSDDWDWCDAAHAEANQRIDDFVGKR